MPPGASSTSITLAGASAGTGRSSPQMVELRTALPRLRRRLADHLGGSELTRERVLACAVRLLDVGLFRIGSEQYADEDRGVGLATIRKDHVLSTGTRSCSTIRPRAASAGCRWSRTRSPGRSFARSSAAAAAAISCWPTANGAGGSSCAPTHQRLSQGRDRRGLQRQGLPDLERHRARGGIGGHGRPRGRAPGPPASGQSTARFGRGRGARQYPRGRTACLYRSARFRPILVWWTVAPALERIGDLDGPDDRGRARLERAVLDLLAGDRGLTRRRREPTNRPRRRSFHRQVDADGPVLC